MQYIKPFVVLSLYFFSQCLSAAFNGFCHMPKQICVIGNDTGAKF